MASYSMELWEMVDNPLTPLFDFNYDFYCEDIKVKKKFEEKFNLPFTLLSDTDLEAIKAYDVWQEKNMYGKKTMGVVRTTYLIDENGIIEKAFGKVKAAENPADMLEELDK